MHKERTLFRAVARHAAAAAGFTLMELMVVVIILGILAATIVPQFTKHAEEAKVGRAKTDIANLSGCLERYYLHMSRYPTSEEGLRSLVQPPTGGEKEWRGPYVKALKPDPWGREYLYRSPGLHGDRSYDLWSRGADGADGGQGDAADLTSWE
jgi:general secretion pathway protein G